MATTTQQVRILIADLGTPPLLTDEQIQTFLDLENSNPYLTAAVALEAIATSEVLVSKKIQTQDLNTDGPAVAAELRQLAASYRARGMAGSELIAGVVELLHAEGEEWF